MSDYEKLSVLKTILNPSEVEVIPDDGDLELYLRLAGDEILSWIYQSSEIPKDDEGNQICVPRRYELTQINSVVVALNLSGSEGQNTHDENGVKRAFKHSTMVEYIRRNVIPKGRVI